MESRDTIKIERNKKVTQTRGQKKDGHKESDQQQQMGRRWAPVMGRWRERELATFEEVGIITSQVSE